MNTDIKFLNHIKGVGTTGFQNKERRREMREGGREGGNKEGRKDRREGGREKGGR